MTKAKGKNYVAIAARYAGDVVSGKILACQWTIKACRRQLDDLERAKSREFPYRFDRDRASRICRFIELLPHIKGEWAKNSARIELQPWQIFILTTVFGWVRRDTGLRRFKTAYLEMPRKQGKSSVSSGVGIYCCCADGEAGSETYSAATTRDQAKIVWQDAWNMVERSPGLKKAFGVSTTAHAISQISTASRFQALSAEGNSLDGLNNDLPVRPKKSRSRKLGMLPKLIRKPNVFQAQSVLKNARLNYGAIRRSTPVYFFAQILRYKP